MDALRKEGDSIGARINVIATGVPPGLGEPVFDRLDADIAKAMMGINAVKGGRDRCRLLRRASEGHRAPRPHHPRRLPEQSRRRGPGRDLLGPGHRGRHRAQTDLQHPATGAKHRSRRQARGGRDPWPPRPLRRDPGDAHRRGHAGLGAHGPPAAPPRAESRGALRDPGGPGRSRGAPDSDEAPLAHEIRALVVQRR